MKLPKIYILLAAIMMSFACINSAFSFSNQRSTNDLQITQWVKISLQQLGDDFHFNVTADNLESSVINCGAQCKIVKLSTTPFTSSGTLTLTLLYKNCYGTVDYDIPFGVSNNILTTPITTYIREIGGSCYQWHHVKASVSGDPKSYEGYSVDMALID